MVGAYNAIHMNFQTKKNNNNFYLKEICQDHDSLWSKFLSWETITISIDLI